MTASEAPPVAETPVATDPVAAESWPFWWWAAPLAALAGLGAVIAFRRRRPAEPETRLWDEPAPEQAAAEPALRATPAPAIVPLPDPAPTPDPVPTPDPAPTPAPVARTAEPAFSFEVVGLRLSLVYATLQYRVSILADADLPPGRMLGDMIGAHGSMSPDEQLGPALDTLASLKTIPPIAAGQSVTLTGEIQLPLGAIRPLQQGRASLFVPLVRLCLLPEDGTGNALRRVYTIGIEAGGAGLSPLRLDTGPREHRDLSAREVVAARDYPTSPADPRRAFG